MLLLEPRKALRKLTKTCRSAKFAILLPWCSGAVAWNLAYEIPYRILSLCLRPACFTAITNYSLEVKIWHSAKFAILQPWCSVAVAWSLKLQYVNKIPNVLFIFFQLSFGCTLVYLSCNSSSPKLHMPIVWKDTMAIIIIICCQTHD